MNDKSLKHATARGTQPARASSDISEGFSTCSAWAIAIAFGTSGGFSPTTAEQKSSSSVAAAGRAAGRPTVGLTGVTGSGTARALLRASLPLASLLPEPLGLPPSRGLAPSFESSPLEEDASLFEFEGGDDELDDLDDLSDDEEDAD